MRVISMVPSWTETLASIAESDGFEVVGRTRFCIHPKESIQKISVVGGTKKIDWDVVHTLKADLLILDREENPRIMADESPIPVLDTHVYDLPSLGLSLRKMSERLGSKGLHELADRLKEIVSFGPQNWQEGSLKILTASARTGFQLGDLKNEIDFSKSIPVNYIIWKDPWMSVAGSTFIGSMLRQIGFTNRHESNIHKYPVLDKLELQNGLNLFSSEPFPFGKKTKLLSQQNMKGLIIDGEPLSWFGIRSVQFLELLASHLRI